MVTAGLPEKVTWWHKLKKRRSETAECDGRADGHKLTEY